jgi:succinate dehydrogenase/fumarate reductase flavoprotein subunit
LKRLVGDVLVIGGGLAGCWAAYRASQVGASVLLADKGRVGTTGRSTFAAGDILWWTPQDDLNQRKWFCEARYSVPRVVRLITERITRRQITFAGLNG